MLKSKIHRARVTDANINYEGSITIDMASHGESGYTALRTGARSQYQQRRPVHHLMPSKVNPAAALFCLNGAAARLAVKGDLVIILTFTGGPGRETKGYQPRIVHVNEKNAIVTRFDEKIFA
jgi:aspartate 1-decarboxylase